MVLEIDSKHKERFMRSFDVSDSGCWIWRLSKNSDNYGKFSVNRKWRHAHRVSFIIHNGQIPEKMCVCHSCDNPECVNPNHLFLGTHSDNMQDSMRKGRFQNQKLSVDKVLAIRAFHKAGIKQSWIARAFGVKDSAIYHIVNRKSWGKIGL